MNTQATLMEKLTNSKKALIATAIVGIAGARITDGHESSNIGINFGVED